MKGIVGNAKFMQHLVKFDLSGLTGVRFGATHKSTFKQMFSQNMLNLGNCKPHNDAYMH